MRDFIAKHAIYISCEPVHSNPNVAPDTFGKDAQHWRCILTLRADGKPREMVVFFSQGAAFTGAPSAESVLECLASDAASLRGIGGFPEWAADLGYDSDSRKAEATYMAVARQTRSLRRWLASSETMAELLSVARE